MPSTPDSAQISQIAIMMRGAVSALATDVRVLPPSSATYRRTMPHLRRAAALLGMGRDAVGDDPTLVQIRRAIGELNAALTQARLGAERLAAAPERTVRALGFETREAARAAGEQLRATTDRIQAAYHEGSVQFFEGGRTLLGGIGGGLAMLLGVLALVYVLSKKR